MLYSYREKKFYVFSEATNVHPSALKTFSARLHVTLLHSLGSLGAGNECVSVSAYPFALTPFLTSFTLYFLSSLSHFALQTMSLHLISFYFSAHLNIPPKIIWMHVISCYDVLPVYVVTTLITSSLACQLSGAQ